MNNDLNKISIVIPAHNNINNLITILKMLQKQTIKPYEIIIVDDNSCQPIEDLSKYYNITFLSIHEEIGSQHVERRAESRQIGVDSSNGNIILFLDGDMIPSRYLLELISYYHNQRKTPFVLKVPKRFKITTDGHIINNIQIPNNVTKKWNRINWQNFTSNCFSVEKNIIEEIGGWDKNFVGWGEEDVELGYRFYKNEIPISSPIHTHLYSIHIDHPIDYEKNFLSLRKNAIYFSKKHPEIKSLRSHCWANLGIYYTNYNDY